MLFIASAVLAYDKLQFQNYDLLIPQWLGLSLAIETRYRIALVQFQLDPSAVHRRQLRDILALLQEYQDAL